jgi:hypothetical protein
MLVPRSLPRLSQRLLPLVRTRLWLQVLIAMALGVAFGIAIGPTTGWVDTEIALIIGAWVALPGKLFLLAIQFVVVPLIVASVIRGIAAGEGPTGLGDLGLKTTLFFVASTVLAVGLGLAVALLIQPGSFVDSAAVIGALAGDAAPVAAPAGPPTVGEIPELIAGLFPRDPLTTFTSGNMLQIVIAAIIIGVAVVLRPTAGAARRFRVAGADQRPYRHLGAARDRHVRGHGDCRTGVAVARLSDCGTPARRLPHKRFSRRGARGHAAGFLNIEFRRRHAGHADDSGAETWRA